MLINMILNIIKEASRRLTAVSKNVGLFKFILIITATNMAGSILGGLAFDYTHSRLVYGFVFLLFSNLFFFKFAYELFGGESNE